MSLGRCPARLQGVCWDRLCSWPCQRDLTAQEPRTQRDRHPSPAPGPHLCQTDRQDCGCAHREEQTRVLLTWDCSSRGDTRVPVPPPSGAPTPD